MTYLTEFLSLGIISFIAVVSPGPDFVVVAQNALTSKRHGVFTAFGIALGILVHTTYCILGIGLIIAQSIVIFNIIKLLGAAYLIYLGIKALISKNSTLPLHATDSMPMISNRKCIQKGLLVNILNPKCTLFILSIFTQFIRPDMSGVVRVSFGLEIALVAFTWFCFLSFLLNVPQFKDFLKRVQGTFDKIMGTLLVGLGLKVAFAHQ